MKRKFSSFALLVPLGLALSACNAVEQQTEAYDETVESAEAVEKFEAETLAPEPDIEVPYAAEKRPGSVVGIFKESTPLDVTYNYDDGFCFPRGERLGEAGKLVGTLKDPDGTIVATVESTYGRWDTETETCTIQVWTSKDSEVLAYPFYTMDVSSPLGTSLTGTSDTTVITLHK